MSIDLETAVRTFVSVAMGQDPGKRVTVGLIVAVLARKFSVFPEEHIAQVVTKAVREAGGTVDLAIPATKPTALKMSA